MRIISGKFKGLTLYAPKDKKIRPLKDMVRESIFNFLIHSNKISFKLKGANILDLYSGVGSFGLECLSRDASKIIFVEKEKDAMIILEKNIDKINEKKKIKIFSNDVLILIKKNIINLKFDLIFCDPPFKDKNIGILIELIFHKKLLERNGLIIFHRDKSSIDKIPGYFNVVDERIYGTSKIVFGNFLS
jgi:16S rRNA (guanine966-N2)-methyltransferase|tara:strand:- start:406 stop:972 length:567 start_codon:yes stop_codon:yes gene_type:complete